MRSPLAVHTFTSCRLGVRLVLAPQRAQAVEVREPRRVQQSGVLLIVSTELALRERHETAADVPEQRLDHWHLPDGAVVFVDEEMGLPWIAVVAGVLEDDLGPRIRGRQEDGGGAPALLDDKNATYLSS